MLDFNPLLQKRLYEIIRLVKIEQIQKGKKASGKSARSLRAAIVRNAGLVLGEAYFYNQEVGTAPQGKGNPPGAFVFAIQRWLKSKGFSAEDAEKAAFPIARKIWNDGTRLHNGKDTPLGLPVIADAQVGILSQEIAAQTSKEVAEFVVTSLSFEGRNISIQ